ncbi:MAG: hypothetical protein QOF51_2945 [Chloroflexota bacterium]|nr:hypothetical protein [Chloroflexota bacterium]
MPHFRIRRVRRDRIAHVALAMLTVAATLCGAIGPSTLPIVDAAVGPAIILRPGRPLIIAAGDGTNVSSECDPGYLVGGGYWISPAGGFGISENRPGGRSEPTRALWEITLSNSSSGPIALQPYVICDMSTNKPAYHSGSAIVEPGGSAVIDAFCDARENVVSGGFDAGLVAAAPPSVWASHPIKSDGSPTNGWEIGVTNNDPNLALTVTGFAVCSADIGPVTWKQAAYAPTGPVAAGGAAICDVGDVVVGGGYDAATLDGSAPTGTFWASSPITGRPQGWAAGPPETDLSGGVSLSGSVYAICARAVPSVADLMLGWGANDAGQVGDRSRVSRSAPASVPLTTIVAITAGDRHSLAVVAPSGELLAWGANDAGQLGIGSHNPPADSPTPAAVQSLEGTQPTGRVLGAVTAAAGATHSLALLGTGQVVAWGGNSAGQLGLGDQQGRDTATTIPDLADVLAIAAGGDHSLALKRDGTVWGWGRNDSGELGATGCNPCPRPVQVPGLTNAGAIAAGGQHSLAIKQDGSVWAWGDNSWGQLGSNDPAAARSSATPVQVFNGSAGAPLTGVNGIAAGARHSLAVRGGQVYTWGAAADGQLGLDPPLIPDTCQAATDCTRTARGPVKVQSSGAPLTDVTLVSAGGAHSLALDARGSVWAWGRNDAGQLGISPAPPDQRARLAQPVAGLNRAGTTLATGSQTSATPAGVVLLAAGGRHSLAAAVSP